MIIIQLTMLRTRPTNTFILRKGQLELDRQLVYLPTLPHTPNPLHLDPNPNLPLTNDLHERHELGGRLGLLRPTLD